jgi:hypothetical protein
MENKFIRKLEQELKRGISSEVHVIYTLVAIRKIIERDISTNYKFLKFHCDWALHATLDGHFAQKIIASFDEIHSELMVTGTSPLTIDASRISGMDDFEKELSCFCRAYNLHDITKDSDDWARFLYYYAKAIEGCPLQLKSRAKSTVSEVIVSVDVTDEILKGHSFFKVSWKIKDVTGKTGEIFIIHSFENFEQ